MEVTEAVELVVIGGGEHARVVMEAARTRPDLWEVKGCVDVQPCEETSRRMGVPHLGPDDIGRKLAASGSVLFVLGMAGLGSRKLRMALAETYDAAGATWATVVHSFAWVSPTAILEGGAFLSAGTVVNSGARVERHAIINTGAVIEHDVIVGDFAQVSPSATIGGGARIGRNAYVGLGASVRDHVTVGESATVGMGAVVVAAVDRDTVVLGSPARRKESLKR